MEILFYLVGAAVAARDGGMPVLQEQKPAPAAILLELDSRLRGSDGKESSL